MFGALILAAIERLRAFYSGNVMTAADPGGMDGDGHTVNFIPALRDVALVGQAVGDVAAAIDGSMEDAAASAAAAAGSAAAASASADRAAQFDPSTYAPKASPAFTGNPTAPTPALGDNDTSITTTAFVQEVARRAQAYALAF